MKTTHTQTVAKHAAAEQFDKLLTIVDRNIHTFARFGGEVNRNHVLQSQAEARRLIDALGQSGIDRAGYAWRNTSAATLNSALERRANHWRTQLDKSRGFSNSVLGGAK